MRDDWQAMLINAALMSAAGLVLLAGAFMLAVKALCRMVRR